jgi:hypothetical protein
MMSWRRIWPLVLVVVAIATACSGTSDAPTARFTILQYPEEGGSVPGSRFEGEGNFASGEVIYTLMIEGEPAFEHQEIGDRSYNRAVGEDVYRGSGETPEARAARAVRNGLAAATDALSHLESIADEVSEVGREEVRGTGTTHYRAVAHLSKLGAPPEDDRFPVEVWIDDSGRTRRYRYEILGGNENYVWEFYDFGVTVDLEAPPPEKVR